MKEKFHIQILTRDDNYLIANEIALVTDNNYFTRVNISHRRAIQRIAENQDFVSLLALFLFSSAWNFH